MSLLEKIQRTRLLLELPGKLWWVTPDGDIVSIPDDSTHMAFVAVNPDKLGLDNDFAKNADLPDLLRQGFIRLRKAGGSLNINMKRAVTRDAFKALRKFVKNRMRPDGIVNVEIGTDNANLTVSQFSNQRNFKALANTVENPPTSVRTRGRTRNEPRDFR